MTVSTENDIFGNFNFQTEVFDQEDFEANSNLGQSVSVSWASKFHSFTPIESN